jgi:hypothetical protein
MLKNQALSGRSNRHLSAFADDLEDQRFLDSIFLNKAVAKDVLIEHLKSRQPGRLPESEAKNLLSLIGVFDQEVDFELILLFFASLGFPNKGFIPRSKYAFLSTVLNTRSKILGLTGFLSRALEKEIHMSAHGIFKSYLKGSERAVFRLVHKINSELENYDYKLIPFYGTLLGIVRDGEFMAHDDDLDFLILPLGNHRSDWKDNMLVLEQIFNVKKYEITNKLDGHMHVRFDPQCHQFDIFVAGRADNRFRVKSYSAKAGYFSIEQGDLSNLRLLELEDFSAYVPVKSEDLLQEIYGANWRTKDMFFGWPWPLDD